MSAEIIRFPAPEDERPYEGAPSEVVSAMGGRTPTVQQWNAISAPLEPRAVVAGAGSGKTAVMAARLTYLALVAAGRLMAPHRGAMPSEVLCLTFTNKAAEELSRRVLRAVEGLRLPEGEEPTVLTYHAFGARLVDEFGLRAGVEPGRRLLSDAQKWQLVGTLLDECTFEEYQVRTDYVVGDALLLADQIANHLVDPAEVARVSRELAREITGTGAQDRIERTALRKRAELADLVAVYQAHKRDLGMWDYGDQIAEAVRVAGTPEVVEAFRERYRVVLLDEYQDTNVAQAEMLKALCGRGYPVFAVGDPDQNIYAWRGASLKNILRFYEDFGEERREGSEALPLYVNFRSGSRILDVADAVVRAIPEERRARDKPLRPHESRGEGEVRAFIAGDAHEEARHIARTIREIAESGGDRRWGRFAVLCRKKRLFPPIQEALREADIPVEVVDLGGLLLSPEVMEVVSWLQLLDDPGTNVALARILMGPRWRIGYRDLVALARWSARHNRLLQEALPGEDDTPADVAFVLAEALDHLDDEEMTGLSSEARARLEEFGELLAELREAVRGSLGDLVAAIAERTGLLRELETSQGEAAAGARRNLLNLLQHVSAFAPVDGEASLSTLVQYLETAQAREEDLEAAQPSGEETVKLLTIHKAKGLEWDVVFVPGMAEHPRYPNASIFPDVSRQPNPLSQARTLPFELRGDRDVLPLYEGDIKAFRAELAARGEEEERRLCYVALTRARELLVCSSAYWYEGPQESHQPGRFLKEVVGREACELVAKTDRPEESPLAEARRRRAERWPAAARSDDTDELFPEGWHRAALEAVEDRATVEWRALQSLDAGEQAAYREALDRHAERAALIRSRTASPPGPSAPTTLSVTGVIDYAKCPKLFYWSQVRPLPRRPSQAARLGSEVHRWIELQSRGQASLLEVEELPDLSSEERMGEPPPAERLKASFRASPYAERVPLFAERPFLLYLDGMVVGGRIDAIFGEPEGPWEVVDYKTGRVPPEDDPIVGLQLDLYALACVEVWGMRPEDLTLTYLYLATGEARTRPAGDLAETRARVIASLEDIASGRWDPSPGPQCAWCDFRAFCPEGQAFLAREG